MISAHYCTNTARLFVYVAQLDGITDIIVYNVTPELLPTVNTIVRYPHEWLGLRDNLAANRVH